jgi:GST-like protein
MNKSYIVYGAPGSGSVPVEAALTLMGVPYEVVGDDVMRPVASNPAANALNPLHQVPVLELPHGEIMTESSAILIYLADRYSRARLAPEPGDCRRPVFLRWMAYVSTAIYGLAWVRADPMRLVADPAQASVIQARIAERRAECWQHMDRQIEPRAYLLGDELTVLDLYVATVSRWAPRRSRFYCEAPKMAAVVRRVDSDPRLADFWRSRFPFSEGWED